MSRKKKRMDLFYFPAQRYLPGRQISDSSPALAAAKSREYPSTGAAKSPPSTTTPSGAGPSTRPRSSRNLHRRKAASKCLPCSARQCSGRAASSRSPSSSGGGGGGASWDAAARRPGAGPERLTPLPARPGPRAPGQPLRPCAASPASPRPWGFASCGAMGTLHTSRPLPRSAPRRGAQLSAPRSSPGISGHGAGAGGRGRRATRLARSSCRARGELRGSLRERQPHPCRGRGRMEPRRLRPGVPTLPAAARRRARAARVDGRRPGSHPGPAPATEGARLRERGLEAAGRARDPPSRRWPLPLRPALLALSLGLGVRLGSGSRTESVTAAQSGASLTKNARSRPSGRRRRGSARAHPRAKAPRAPRSRAPGRGPSRPSRAAEVQMGWGSGERALPSPTSPPSGRGEIRRRDGPGPKMGGIWSWSTC